MSTQLSLHTLLTSLEAKFARQQAAAEKTMLQIKELQALADAAKKK